MELLEKICRELGVEIGEEWLGSDGQVYTILNNGDINRYEKDTGYEFQKFNMIWSDILNGILKPIWKPRKGEEFCLVDLTDEDLYDVTFWSDSEINQKWLERGLVFKSSEEAIRKANKMLEAIKEDKNDSI